jgi:Ca2+-binding RTX toxin-like protein
VGDPGGNTLVANGLGGFVDNQTEIPMLTMGNTFEVDAMPAFSSSDLVLFGTAGPDHVKFQSSDAPGVVEVSATSMATIALTPNGRLIAYGGEGDDTMQASGDVAQAVWLFGEEGNDRLKGGGSDDLLSGGSGDDLLVGKTGLDLLIGGLGADRLVGNQDDDILVAGRVALSEALLALVMAEWTSGIGTYADRQGNVRTYLRTDDLLGDPTVFADESKDVLTGSAGVDWFFANLGGEGVQDKITDLSSEEFQPDLEFILAE